jgi:tetratricopeptide (TPR) repeat protein
MTSAMPFDEVIDDLRARVRHYAADRYPVQHATARFHLGLTLLHGGSAADAVTELGEAATVFGSSRMAVEHAKATLMLGVALRDVGRLEEAEDAFTGAASAFAELHQRSELAAALHNLGMVLRDRGDPHGAAARFTEAAAAFDELGEHAARTSADRELGATLLALDQPERGVPPLRRAMEEAGERGDAVAWGAAANALGIALLALGDASGAEEAFRAAVSAAPRTVRPEGYAMAKANLALAYEEAQAPVRARLAARQARAVPEAPEVVVAQADGVVARLGEGVGDLVAVLDEEPADGWATVLRDEMSCWADLDDRRRVLAAAAWIAGVLERRSTATDLLLAWLDAVLELPPGPMDRVLGAVVTAWAQHDDAQARDDFRSLTSRVLPRFHLPQWQRLQAAFERHAAEAGEPATWR